MRLLELEFENFKSFKGHVTVPLGPGFTCITGPNGSGKSNITDAILFILGSRSTKILRARKLNQLINGYQEGNKKKTGPKACKVSMVFDNSDRFLAIEKDHVTFTKGIRLRKNDTVTYYQIDGVKSSASEFEALFSRAGLYATGYNIIQQGDVIQTSLMSGTEGGDIISLIVFVLAIIAVFMTAFYMFRALFMTFEGDFRGGSEKDPEAKPHGPVHLGESPFLMVVPMVILAVPAVIIGFIANPPGNLLGIEAHWMVHTLDHMYHLPKGEAFNIPLAAVSTLVALSGIALAIAMYKPKPIISAESIGKTLKPLHTILYKKYYFDELYEGVFVRQIYYRGIALASDWSDRNIVDRIVNIVGWLGANFGGLIRQFQNGQIQMYATVTSIGIIVIAAMFIFGD